MVDLINDRALRTLSLALNGYSARQQAIAENVANLDTPGYKAGRVSFESQLRAQVQGADTVGPKRTSRLHLPSEAEGGIALTRDQSRSMRLDGNNVDIDWEMARLAETVINYNTVSELVSMKLAILKSVIKAP